jgi:hypothetical protein
MIDLHKALKYFETPERFRDSYAAGYDCGMYGPNTNNCHFGWFKTREMTKEWERGKKDGEKFR